MSTLKAINVVHPYGTVTNIVNDNAGNITVGNNLTVTGSETVSGNLTVTGSETVSGNLTVTGTATITGNETVGGTLGVTGTTTLAAATATSMSVAGTPVIAVAPGTSGNILKSNGTVWQSVANSGTGTVTSITAGTGLSGGTITTSGTIALVTTLNAVGTYAMCYDISGSLRSPGSTTAGSNLYYSNASGAYLSSPQPSGTWQCMGFSFGCCSGAGYQVTLFLRIA